MKRSIVVLLSLFVLLFPLVAAADDYLFDSATGSITGWNGKTTVAEIPEEIDGIPVTAVSSSAFQGCTELETVFFPAGIEQIADCAFSECTSLTYLVFDALELPVIGASAFSDCPLADVDLAWNATREAAEAAQGIFDSMGFTAKVWRGNHPSLEVPAEGYLYNETTIADTYAFTAYTGTQTAIYPHYYLVFENGDIKPVTALGEGVFSGQTQLKKFAIPHSDRFTTIGNEAFADSGLEWIDLYDTVTEIGRGAFRNCVHLQSLTLTSSVRKIGTEAFAGCSGLTDLYIGCSASVLPRNAFADSTNLSTVTIDSDGVPDKLFAELPITDVTFGQSVEKIGTEAFRGTSIKTLVLPETLKTVGAKAFDSCLELESVTILSDADALPKDAFKDCVNLKTVTIAKGSIPDGFLKDSSIETLVLGEDVVSIGKNAFANTNLTDVLLPAKAEVSQNAFAGIAYEEIRIADEAEDSHIDALNKAMNRPWYLPVQRVAEGPALQSMPPLQTDENAFLFDEETGSVYGYTGSAKTVVVPRQIGGIEVQTIQTLGDAAISDAIHTLILPETVTRIDANAFTNCSRLKTVLCYGPLNALGEGAFQNCTALETAVFVNGIYQIDAYAFDGCTELKELWWKGTANRIGEYAFRNTALETFHLSVRRLEKAAFQNCASLRQMHFRTCVERIGTNVFDGCNALEKLCFEINDSSAFREGAHIGTMASQPIVILPADTTPKKLQSMYRILSTGNSGPVNKREDIVLAECELPQMSAPDVEALLLDTAQ